MKSASPSLLLSPDNRSSRWVRGCVECTLPLPPPLPSPEGRVWPLEEAQRAPALKPVHFSGCEPSSPSNPVPSSGSGLLIPLGLVADRWVRWGAPNCVIGGGSTVCCPLLIPPLPPAWTPTTRVAVWEPGGSVQPEKRTWLPSATPGHGGATEGRRWPKSHQSQRLLAPVTQNPGFLTPV